MVIIKLVGGIGNQLFQIVGGLELASFRNKKLYVDLSHYNQRFGVDDNNRMPIKEFLTELKIDIVQIPKWKILLYHVIDNIFLRRQYKKLVYVEDHLKDSYNLFLSKNYKQIISTYFGFGFGMNYIKTLSVSFERFILQKNNYSKVKDKLSFLIGDSEVVVIHIRRGDYLSNDQIYLNLLDCSDYYELALNIIKINTSGSFKILIFSDDINLKNNLTNNLIFSSISDNIYYYNEIIRDLSIHDDLLDLYFMASFDSLVIANSTFSSWAAFFHKYFSRNTGKVYFPFNWYTAFPFQKKWENTSVENLFVNQHRINNKVFFK